MVAVSADVIDFQSGEPERLYTANEVASKLGMTRHWVLEHSTRVGAPRAEFTTMRGSRSQPLWTEFGVDRWRAYHAGDHSVPRHRKADGYSDHKAVNQVGPVTVTWKLAWRPTFDGGVMWWFSTPRGWYVSNDDGQTWDFADTMIRPGDYRYQCVNVTMNLTGHIGSVLRSAEKLRRQLESS